MERTIPGRFVFESYTDEPIFNAGQRVPAGTYRVLGGGRTVHLPEEDLLPASLDGRVAAYVRVRRWRPELSRDH